ncbi:MAG: protein kinase domain-containing protein [Planctomycetota bacterium]
MTTPYLCRCGAVLNVGDIAAGGRFRCPECKSETVLDRSDPALLANNRGSDGVYDLLLKRRFAQDPRVFEAIPLDPRPTFQAGTGLQAESGGLAVTDRAQAATARADANAGMTLTAPISLPLPNGAGRPIEVASCSGAIESGKLLGPFLIDGVLGAGGMGVVYRAVDTLLERTVALKVLGEEHVRDSGLIERFRREAQAAAALTHPNITHIYSIGEDQGRHYFAMELVRGRTLATLLNESSQLDETTAIDYLAQTVRGLRAAHERRIIHRDIKPSNLILSDEGLIKITDFGLAKVLSSPIDITATGVIIGTPLYMSPEQGKGEPLDHRSDIYSLGCTFYHLLGGAPPFGGDSAMRIIVCHITEEPEPIAKRCPALSGQVAEVITRMIAKEPRKRFQSYEQILDALTRRQTLVGGASSVVDDTAADPQPNRVTLRSEGGLDAAALKGMSLKQLSVADANLELHRHDKAQALYQRVLTEHPKLEVELGFRLLKIAIENGQVAEQAAWLARLERASANEMERFFCRWKILASELGAVRARLATIAERIEALRAAPVPEGIQLDRLEQRLLEVRQLDAKLASDLDVEVRLVRRSGDLELELD